MVDDARDLGIGRLRYLAYSLVINLLSGIAYLFVPNINATNYNHNDIAGFIYCVSFFQSWWIAWIIQKRLKNIGVSSHESWSVIWFLISMGFGIWAGNAYVASDVATLAVIGVLAILIGLPVKLYLLFRSSKESRHSRHESKNLQKIKNDLLQQKENLTQAQEIEKLKGEVQALKGEQLRAVMKEKADAKSSLSIKVDNGITGKSLGYCCIAIGIAIVGGILFGEKYLLGENHPHSSASRPYSIDTCHALQAKTYHEVTKLVGYIPDLLFFCAEAGAIKLEKGVAVNTALALDEDAEKRGITLESFNLWYAANKGFGMRVANYTKEPISKIIVGYKNAACSNDGNERFEKIMRIDVPNPISPNAEVLLQWDMPSDISVTHPASACMDILSASP